MRCCFIRARYQGKSVFLNIFVDGLYLIDCGIPFPNQNLQRTRVRGWTSVHSFPVQNFVEFPSSPGNTTVDKPQYDVHYTRGQNQQSLCSGKKRDFFNDKDWSVEL